MFGILGLMFEWVCESLSLLCALKCVFSPSGVDRRPRRGAAIRLSLRKNDPRFYVFLRRWLVDQRLEATDNIRGSIDSNFPTSKIVCHASTVLIFIDGIEMSKMLNIFWFIKLSSAWIGYRCASISGAGVSMVMALKGLISKFRSLRPGGMVGCSLT